MQGPSSTRSDPESRRAYTRWHYEQNRDVYKARARAKNLETRAVVRSLVLEYLLSHPCVDCGEADPIVLEFDHRPGEEKNFNIADAVRRGFSARSTQSEIAKCDVRCANCHRRVTYKRAGHTHKDIAG